MGAVRLGQDRLVEVSERLTRWVIRTFPTGTAERVLQELRDLAAELIGGQDAERVRQAWC
jgi:hypothetical protein